MADKVQKIKEWVKNLKSQASTIPNLGINALAGFQLACDDVIAFINSIPKEFGCEVNCTTKSEDLEEAAELYYEEDCPYEGDARVINNEHDVWFPSQAIEDAFIAGAEWQKQQMMKDAVEGVIVAKERSTIPPFQIRCKIVADRVPIDAEEDDKVKVLIIETE